MHLSDGELEALQDGEAVGTPDRAASSHVAACPVCSSRMRELQELARWAGRQLAALDHAVPDVSADAVIARARRQKSRRRAVAAGTGALLLAAAAAAAVPGSPLRRYVVRGISGGRSSAPPAELAAPRPASASGVALVPETGLVVTFRAAQREGSIHILLTDSLVARITHEGGSAGYAVARDRVSVDNMSSNASYRITVPRSLMHVEVLVGSRVAFAKDGARISTAAAQDAAGWYVIAFSQLSSRTP